MKKSLYILLSVCVCAMCATASESSVRAWEENLTIPTYVLDAPEKAPIFDCDWSYQRARRSVYPYPLNDNMTRVKKDVVYKALYLENEYVKICILPEIGGRLFYAIDKTNNYDIFYHQDVIKPANVGMTGAWISGGVEWNVFHHHRTTSHAQVDYKIVENSDGGKTVWLGETELRHRMSWAIGVTLRPAKSYMEIDGRLVNSTQNANSMLYWSNVSTHVDKNYQIIFPQNTKFATFHCKSSFCHWPITHEAFTNVEEYCGGVHASWWKAHPVGNSVFVHDLQDDFIAGYDHGRDAGTMLVGNHHIVKGGKFWSWGPNSGWPTKILTDTAGHYIELMTGAYSDNQPDYNWTYPYEVKQFKKYWYGIRNIGGAKKASKLAAMNVEQLDNGKILVGVNSTERRKNLKVSVARNGAEIFSQTFDAAPDVPFVKTFDAGKPASETELSMRLLDSDGKVLLDYQPVAKDPNEPLPQIVKPPLPPSQIANNEECFLVGLRNLQFHNPFVKPTDYFLEVLRRDPSDTRANTQMGVWCRLRGDYAAAEKYLRTAIARQTKDYTRPKDCEATYNLGLVLKAEGRSDEAIETLYRAVWNYAFNSAANFQLAQIYSTRGDYDSALERLDEAVVYNGHNLSALNLKATILRKRGDIDGAKKCLETVLKFDPVNAYAACENEIVFGGNTFRKLMRDNTESYIELALAYLHNGFPREALKLLEYADSKRAYPTVKFWLGEFADRRADKSAAKKFFKAALDLPVDYCNPFRLETADVLEKVAGYFPESDKLHYYLGNIWFDKQPDRAVSEWKKCVSLNPSHALALRNIGWAYWKQKYDCKTAAEYYLKAVELAPDNALFLEEIDQVLEGANAPVQLRYDLLKKRHNICVKRYYPLAAEVVAGTFLGDYDYVLKLLRECYFPTREGVANFHDIYVDALLTAGADRLAKGDSTLAAELFAEAFKFPENHQVFLYDTRRPRDAQIYFMLGSAYEKSGDKSAAEINYKKAAAVDVKKTDYRYWKGLALEKIGETQAAKSLFRALVNEANRAMTTTHVNFYGAEGTTGDSVDGINARAFFSKGLGELGLGDKSAAKSAFEKSVSLKPCSLWPTVMLKSLQ